MTDLLFVYGTLLSKVTSPLSKLMVQSCTYYAEGHISGRLYEVKDYPGAVESDDNNEKVFGELYRINSPSILFYQLDAYEACSAQFPQPHEYLRKCVKVNLANGAAVVAWCYLYNHDPGPLKQILSGDYLRYLGV